MSAVQGPCILCGAPRPPKARKYCAACARKQSRESTKRCWMKYYGKNFAGKIHQKPAAPAKPMPTPEEMEAAARARSTNGWIDADIVKCSGCIYWRRLGCYVYACHYSIDTPYIRPMPPNDCYKHSGTPYQKKGE